MHITVRSLFMQASETRMTESDILSPWHHIWYHIWYHSMISYKCIWYHKKVNDIISRIWYLSMISHIYIWYHTLKFNIICDIIYDMFNSPDSPGSINDENLEILASIMKLIPECINKADFDRLSDLLPHMEPVQVATRTVQEAIAVSYY